ncbi:MAG: hypothetical protein J6S85_01665 [Methanobrevibacter sp.]|nr:hypothetical protein [Methanobrevibacter sp.]MBO7712242.1 hypothetical protein [Methanobrevibacter sp.]
MIKKILAILSAIGAFLSAVFYVLFRQAKAERQLAEKEAQEEKQKKETIEKVAEKNKGIAQKIARTEAEDEGINNKINSGNTIDNFNAGIELLRKQAESGRKRNNNNITWP